VFDSEVVAIAVAVSTVHADWKSHIFEVWIVHPGFEHFWTQLKNAHFVELVLRLLCFLVIDWTTGRLCRRTQRVVVA
jgi:hypothetical protein